MSYWVGVKTTPPHGIFWVQDDDTVTEEKYSPKYEYVVGPFGNKQEATVYARSHKNLDGTFTDPFCNNGGGR